MKTFFTLLAAALLAGCATTSTPKEESPLTKIHPRHVEFRESDFVAFSGTGTGKISGQAFLKTRGGTVKYGAGADVTLIPKTAYSTEYFLGFVRAGLRLAPADKAFYKFVRHTTADGSGNFEFTGLPEGSYYAYTLIQWEVPSRYGLGLTGGIANGEVQVKAGGTAKVIVTR